LSQLHHINISALIDEFLPSTAGNAFAWKPVCGLTQKRSFIAQPIIVLCKTTYFNIVALICKATKILKCNPILTISPMLASRSHAKPPSGCCWRGVRRIRRLSGLGRIIGTAWCCGLYSDRRIQALLECFDLGVYIGCVLKALVKFFSPFWLLPCMDVRFYLHQSPLRWIAISFIY
jgi:hypothetical protein